MCGRYALYGPRAFSRAEREYFEGLDEFPASYNVAPTDTMPIVRRREGALALTPAKWGFVPYWAKDAKSGVKAINARSETCTSSPLFRSAYRERRRCLVPASGFYEWAATPAGKQPYFITSADGALLAFAGLWEQWRAPDGEKLVSYTIITGAANETVSRLHARMPVIVAPQDYDEWLSGGDPLRALEAPAADALVVYPVSTRVNKPQENDADLVQAADAVKHVQHEP